MLRHRGLLRRQLRLWRRLLIEKPTESNKTKKSKKKSKKEQLEQNKKHADLFGEAEAGEYDNYEDQYDDFF